MSLLDQIRKKRGPIKADSCEKRISYLKGEGFDVSHIESGLQKVENKLKNGLESTVIYGEPQSGKTEFMIALTCKLLDLGYKNIFVIMNDDLYLEQQNLGRFQKAHEIRVSPDDAVTINANPEKISRDKKHVIFCRKNASVLSKLIETTRMLGNRVVIDDEADYASPDTKINKEEEDASKINELVEKLITTKPANQEQKGIYLGVTATPVRLFHNNTFFNKAKEWIFLDPYPDYVGREQFFPMNQTESKFIFNPVPEEGNNDEFLRDAVFRYLLRSSFLHLSRGFKPYTMLIHTSGLQEDHQKDQDLIIKIIDKLKSEHEGYIEKMMKIAKEIFTEEELSQIPTSQPDISPEEELVLYVAENITSNQILEINAKSYNRENAKRATEPTSFFTFGMGGNKISRGLTFNNLLSFYFTRQVKGKMQQNTYIQRARQFGARLDYLNFFEISAPQELMNDWKQCFFLHELSLASHKRGVIPVSFSDKSVRAVDNAATDKSHIDFSSGEIKTGIKFQLNNEIKDLIEDESKKPLDVIEGLLNKGLISEEVFPRNIIETIKMHEDDEDTIMMVLNRKDGGIIKSIEDFRSDYIVREELVRMRGIVDTVKKGQKYYEGGRHFICPIRNSDGVCRFYYRPVISYTIGSNLKAKN